MYLSGVFTGQWLLLFTAWTIALGWAQPKTGYMKKHFTIADNSRLSLKGVSNVNTFTCNCEERYNPQIFELEQQEGRARFLQTSLKISTRKFNCQNDKIDHDMRKALKAEKFPYIQIDLLETRQDVGSFRSGDRDWFDIQAKVRITICGVQRIKTIPAKAMALSDSTFRLKGVQPIVMSEFGIAPPSALFGLIQVQDQIDFHFDLFLSISELS
ncbi:MAG: YceI family protein [Saprospiraceae bacterium]